VFKGSPGFTAKLPKIRFLPDGYPDERSPRLVIFKQGDDGEIWIGQSANAWTYEIETNHVQTARR
jgi:hypothetical protein